MVRCLMRSCAASSTQARVLPDAAPAPLHVMHSGLGLLPACARAVTVQVVLWELVTSELPHRRSRRKLRLAPRF